jgi:hypothetical protein
VPTYGMDQRRAPMDPGEAGRPFAERLEEAALPPFVSAEHDTDLDLLKVIWAHGVTLYMDLTRDDIIAPIDEHGRAVILGLRPCCDECAEAIDVYAPGSREDPCTDTTLRRP